MKLIVAHHFTVHFLKSKFAKLNISVHISDKNDVISNSVLMLAMKQLKPCEI